MTLRGPRGAALLLLAAAAAVAATLVLFPPAAHRIYPFCPVREWTGLACPLCGMTRAFAALLRGRVGEALHRNALVVAAAAALAIPATTRLYSALRWNRSGAPLIPARVVGPLLAVALLFGLARNIAPE
jgi:hypothetical protein